MTARPRREFEVKTSPMFLGRSFFVAAHLAWSPETFLICDSRVETATSGEFCQSDYAAPPSANGRPGEQLVRRQQKSYFCASIVQLMTTCCPSACCSSRFVRPPKTTGNIAVAEGADSSPYFCGLSVGTLLYADCGRADGHRIRNAICCTHLQNFAQC